MTTGNQIAAPCACDETVGFDHNARTVHCHKCGDWWTFAANDVIHTPGGERSVTIAETMIADAVSVKSAALPTDAAPSVPSLANLLAEWQKRRGLTLPLDSNERKLIPLHSGCYAYFAAALAAVAAWSYHNNQKHNPGQPLHWSQGKSRDHEDCIARHGVDVGDARVACSDEAQLIELTARAWRALAELQMFAQGQGAPVPPGARAAEAEVAK